jgi:hypothetical protein
MNAGFKWKVKMLRDMGYSDWKSESILGPSLSYNMLYGACQNSDLQEVLFGLEVAGLDPNTRGTYNDTALDQASERNFLKGAVTLVECGAEVDFRNDIDNETPLMESLWNECGGDVTHYLLLQGANPQLKNQIGWSSWQQIWAITFNFYRIRLTTWLFISLEGRLAHLLLHGSDPFELFIDSNFLHGTGSADCRYASILQLRGPEMARTCSYGLSRQHRFVTDSKDWVSKFEDAERSRAPRRNFGWSPSGVIHEMKGDEYPQATEDVENHYISVGSPKGELGCQDPDDFIGNSLDGSGYSSGSECESGSCSGNNAPEEVEWHPFFRGQTQFYSHISSAKGRKLLSRFPMVLALCDALQFAGYRAEIDEDGDIWYEIDDGDRYFDAREDIPEVCDDNRMREFCPICQDFEGHGLGHIVREVEEAKRELLEYREKVKAKKYCWY